MRVGFFVAFVGSVLAANWAVETFGLVPVGFGLSAPAGVYVVGLALVLRDGLQEAAGRLVVVLAILLGAALSAFVSESLALASALAFLISESLDFLVYDRLRGRGYVVALAASNTVGIILDSVVFLWVAFGSLAFLPGQIVGKGWMTVLAIAVLVGGRVGGVLPRRA